MSMQRSKSIKMFVLLPVFTTLLALTNRQMFQRRTGNISYVYNDIKMKDAASVSALTCPARQTLSIVSFLCKSASAAASHFALVDIDKFDGAHFSCDRVVSAGFAEFDHAAAAVPLSLWPRR